MVTLGGVSSERRLRRPNADFQRVKAGRLWFAGVGTLLKARRIEALAWDTDESVLSMCNTSLLLNIDRCLWFARFIWLVDGKRDGQPLVP
jgi:hypothetical protein